MLDDVNSRRGKALFVQNVHSVIQWMSHHLVDSAGGIDFPVAYPVDSDLSGALNSHHSNNWGQISFKPDNHTDPATEIFVHKMFKQMQQATTKNFG